ncbi:ribonuclease D [Psychrobacter sp. I-STPA6b]|uniref:ribonuclease D n=1 Tax=Psychrobacter sp. I-STPA6b TaxID=2585718 RepID=UPI001D0C4E1E|nr:HRDC domain-containing protein [Psychrobacter sp. I-STPA6b]
MSSTSIPASQPPPSDKSNKPMKDKKIATIDNPKYLAESAHIRETLQASEQLPVHWVRSFDDLENCLDVLETCERIALDTEFIKRDTYYPKLALVQVNTGKEIYLIDAPKLDLREFWVVLEEMPLMIWHACGEDLGIFYLLSDCPALKNVFDTQIALSYLTGQLQMGYQQALAQELAVAIDKEQSQSDWLARPLTHEQEQYAIDDVRYLLALYDILMVQLRQQNLVDKVEADCQLYAQELYEMANIEDDATYLAMADYRYSSQQLAVLQAVSAWREALARATNQPRTFILRKQAVRDVVIEMPSTMKQLSHKTVMHRNVLRLYGEELLTVIQNAKSLNEAEQPARILPPYRSKDKTITKAVQAAINRYEQQTGVPANVLMRKKWLSQLYEVVAFDLPLEQLPEGLQGWRQEWVVNTLIPVIEEHKEELKTGMGLYSDNK